MEPVVDLRPPDGADDWVALTGAPLPVSRAAEWASRPDCGAVVTFCGTARDHAEGRPGVTELSYEAYEEQVVPRLAAIAAAARDRWALGRIALLHRVGPVAIGESSVVVVASSAHRHEAFSAARFAIDRLKATVPIWKREVWDGGEDWGLDASPVGDLTDDTFTDDAFTDVPFTDVPPTVTTPAGRGRAPETAN